MGEGDRLSLFSRTERSLSLSSVVLSRRVGSRSRVGDLVGWWWLESLWRVGGGKEGGGRVAVDVRDEHLLSCYLLELNLDDVLEFEFVVGRRGSSWGGWVWVQRGGVQRCRGRPVLHQLLQCACVGCCI